MVKLEKATKGLLSVLVKLQTVRKAEMFEEQLNLLIHSLTSNNSEYILVVSLEKFLSGKLTRMFKLIGQSATFFNSSLVIIDSFLDRPLHCDQA